MTSKRRKWLLILLGVIATALTVWLTRDRGPSYQGKTLDEWIEGYTYASLDPLTGLPTRQDHDRAAAIRAMGTNALPRLLELTRVETTGRGNREAIGDLLLKLPSLSGSQRIIDWKYNAKALDRASDAAVAFGALGTNALPAIPELAQRINATNHNIMALALISLGHIGEAAMPTLLAQLASTNAQRRVEVIHLFQFHCRFGTRNSVPIPQLISCLEDDDINVRKAATKALLKIAPDVLTNAPPR